jgi:hypothetical protein
MGHGWEQGYADGGQRGAGAGRAGTCVSMTLSFFFFRAAAWVGAGEWGGASGRPLEPGVRALAAPKNLGHFFLKTQTSSSG